MVFDFYIFTPNDSTSLLDHIPVTNRMVCDMWKSDQINQKHPLFFLQSSRSPLFGVLTVNRILIEKSHIWIFLEEWQIQWVLEMRELKIRDFPLFNPKSLKWQIREFPVLPYLTRKFGEKFQIFCYFHQKPAEVRQKLSHLANLALIRDFQSQK